MKLTPLGKTAIPALVWFVLTSLVMFSGYPWLAGIMVWLGIPALCMVYLVLADEKERSDK